MTTYDLYEVQDMRELPPGQKLAPIAVLENRPGRLHVLEVTGKSFGLDISGDNYEWKDAELTVYAPEGMVHFSPLTPDSDALAFVDTPFSGLVEDCLR